jgi:hypothetical protein
LGEGELRGLLGDGVFLGEGIFGGAPFAVAGNARVDVVADLERGYRGANRGDGAGSVVTDLVRESGWKEDVLVWDALWEPD